MIRINVALFVSAGAVAGLLRRAALRSVQPGQSERFSRAGSALQGLCGRLRTCGPFPHGRRRGQPQLLEDQPRGHRLPGSTGPGEPRDYGQPEYLRSGKRSRSGWIFGGLNSDKHGSLEPYLND
jgi:hypothetical protein